jgi:ATP-dependent DNA helicase RecQ
VQKLLSTIYRTGQRFGAVHVLDVLRGSDGEKVKQWGHDKLSTFGIGADKPEPEWRAILRQAIALGLVEIDHENYGALRLPDAARSVLKGERSIAMRQYQKPAKHRKPVSKPGGFSEIDLSVPQQALFEKLRWWRVETARSHNVPAYVIFHDATLREIARAMPVTLDELRQVSGVGEKKLETYGEQLIALVSGLEAA